MRQQSSNVREVKIPGGLKPAFKERRVIFKMHPRLFNSLWSPFPNPFITYSIVPSSGRVEIDGWFCDLESMPITNAKAKIVQSFAARLSGWGNLLLQSDGVSLELKLVENPKAVLAFLEELEQTNFALPSLAKLGLQKPIPMRTRIDFLRNKEYSRFISSQEEIENTPMEQILHNADEILSFVHSRADEPESRLLLDWLVDSNLKQLKIIKQESLNRHSDPDTWTIRSQRGDASPQEKEIYKGKVYAFRESAKLTERFDALYDNAREEQANSLWVADDRLLDTPKGIVLMIINLLDEKS